ncbi:MAG: FkbM family methyltransferase [Vicinamibacterales bacterium]
MRLFLTRLIALYLRHSPLQFGRPALITFALGTLRREGRRIGKTAVRTIFGYRMALDLGDWVDQYIYLTGQYEEPTTEVVKALVRPGDAAVDVGANIGYFSLLLANITGTSGAVWAFEPVPGTNQRLRQNVALNNASTITVRNEAVADNDTEQDIFAGPEDHSGIASLRPVDGSTHSVTVPVRRLTSCLPANTVPRLIKIDVEGAEYLALQGMKDILSAHHPDIVLEVSTEYLAEMGHSPVQIHQELAALGYRMYMIAWEGLVALPAWHSGLPVQFNALFTTRPSLPANIRIKTAFA